MANRTAVTMDTGQGSHRPSWRSNPRPTRQNPTEPRIRTYGSLRDKPSTTAPAASRAKATGSHRTGTSRLVRVHSNRAAAVKYPRNATDSNGRNTDENL